MLYSELKSWFEENMNDLPETLYGDFIYYPNVKASAKRAISTVENHIQKHGTKGIRNFALPSAAKANLQTLFEKLKDPDKWNVEKPEKFNGKSTIFKFESKKAGSSDHKPKETKRTLEHLAIIEGCGASVDYDQKIITLQSGLPMHVRKSLEFVKKKGFITEKSK